MTSTAQYTTLAAWPLAICRALEAKGINPEPLLKSSDLNRCDFIDQPDGRINITLMTRFWQAVETETNDPAFGLSVANFVQPMHFRALGMLMLTDKNLESAIMKLGQYSDLVSNSVTTRTERTPELIGLCIDPIASVEIHPMAIDSFFASIVAFCKQLGVANDLVDHIQLLRPQPSHTSQWQLGFNAPIEFSAQQNCLWLKREQLNNSGIMGNEQLATFNESVVVDYIDNMNPKLMSLKVKKLIMASLENGEPSLQAIAEQLNLSERSLRRRLTDENLSYREILKTARMELASYYLSKTEQPITQIALLLGFTDTSNFSRAFTRWFEQSPSKFRSNSSNK
jgi:AraC-like DNA-binding protein